MKSPEPTAQRGITMAVNSKNEIVSRASLDPHVAYIVDDSRGRPRQSVLHLMADDSYTSMCARVDIRVHKHDLKQVTELRGQDYRFCGWCDAANR